MCAYACTAQRTLIVKGLKQAFTNHEAKTAHVSTKQV